MTPHHAFLFPSIAFSNRISHCRHLNGMEGIRYKFSEGFHTLWECEVFFYGDFNCFLLNPFLWQFLSQAGCYLSQPSGTLNHSVPLHGDPFSFPSVLMSITHCFLTTPQSGWICLEVCTIYKPSSNEYPICTSILIKPLLLVQPAHCSFCYLASDKHWSNFMTDNNNTAVQISSCEKCLHFYCPYSMSIFFGPISTFNDYS